MKACLSVLLTIILSTASLLGVADDKDKEFYELRVYELTGGGSLAPLENYFTKALIPALNKNGVKNVGVFKETSKSEPMKVYLLIPYASFSKYLEIKTTLSKDTEFQKASEAYNKQPADKPIYDRFESYMMLAFDGIPTMKVPENKQRIFELRFYQGYNEDATKRKIKMFNDGELEVFYKTKLNPVFFGEVISGKNMPFLAYMITFKDMAERDANWKAFSADPKWIEMRGAEEYKDTVSKIVRVFLEPMEYSQI